MPTVYYVVTSQDVQFSFTHGDPRDPGYILRMKISPPDRRSLTMTGKAVITIHSNKATQTTRMHVLTSYTQFGYA